MTLLLTREELVELTGYRRPADQLRELLRQGYYRARRSPVTGSVIVERIHAETVQRIGLGSRTSSGRMAMATRRLTTGLA